MVKIPKISKELRLTMHVKKLIYDLLSPVMHKKRLITLTMFVMATLTTNRLTLSEVGRALALPIKERSGIRRSDRFLGNKKLHAEHKTIYKILSRRIVGLRAHPDIIVDWSSVPNTKNHILRAAIVADGRALTLYEEVHPEKELGNKRVQNKFLQTLKEILPEECKPVIITDAGFHNDWFKKVIQLGWDCLGRIRGKKYFRLSGKAWQLCSNLFTKATSRPKYLGKAEICKSNVLSLNLCIFKSKKKGRKELNKSGRKRTDGTSLEYRKSANEPWLLVTSLPESYFLAKRVVKKYRTRMQIEESFRDLKSSRYGFGFENAYSQDIKRIEVLLLIAMLASFIAWLTGVVVERKKLHYGFQSNTTKNRRVLSLFFVGCQAIKRKIRIRVSEFISAIDDGLCSTV